MSERVVLRTHWLYFEDRRWLDPSGQKNIWREVWWSSTPRPTAEPGPDSYFHLDWCPLPFFVSLEDSWRVSASSWPAVQPFEMLSYLKNIAKDTTDRELSVLAQTSCKQLEQDRSIIMCCQTAKRWCQDITKMSTSTSATTYTSFE